MIVLFTFSLTLSLVIPLIALGAFLLFALTYFLEKYRIMSEQSLSFDSSTPLRRSLILYPLYSIGLFQTLMLTICSSVFPQNVSVYLLAGLVIEVLICLSIFEFSERKPWEGRELGIERVIQEEQDRLFESISSYHFGFESGGGGNRIIRSGSFTQK